MISIIAAVHPRSGTSMMMKACEAGGMKVCIDPTRERLNELFSDKFVGEVPGLIGYKVNESGMYEEKFDYENENKFPSDYEGKVIKCPDVRPLFGMPEHEYKIILMIRDWKEIVHSYKAAFNRPPIFENEKKYLEILSRAKFIFGGRSDVDLLVIDYVNLLENKEKYIKEIKSHGWEIHTQRFSSVIRSSSRRFVSAALPELQS